MIRSKSCGLLLAFFIIFGLSLSVCSDTNALKYEITTIPFGLVVSNQSLIRHNEGGYRISYPFNDPFRIGFVNCQTVDDSNNTDCLKLFSDSLYADNYTFNFNYDSVLSKCVWGGGRHMYNNQYTNTSLHRYDFDFPYYADDLSYSLPSNYYWNPLCNVNNAVPDPPGYNDVNFPPYTLGQPNWRSFLPYRYSSNGIYFYDEYNDDGLHRQNKFNLLDLFSDPAYWEGVNYIRIPLGRFSSGFESINSDTQFTFKFVLYFDSDDPAEDVFNPNYDSTISLNIKGFSGDWSSTPDVSPSNHNTSSDCRLSESLNSNPDEAPHILTITCDAKVDSSISHSDLLGATLEWYSNDSGYSLIDYPATFATFDVSYLVTNNDETPANVNFSDYVVDGNGDIIGSARPENNGDVSWFQSLINLFDFHFIDPFATIFLMFTNQDQCAQIPTLKSMLHSEESQVCPFFDSTTRSITTPVLSIVASMLLFGFVVRWLGSSSGNMFEDQTSHKWANTQFKQKGG